jgi:hypothetical protein
MAEVNGYILADKPLRNGICQSYEATKDGKKYFFKIYRYEVDKSITPEKHMAEQDRINKVLSELGNITEDIIDPRHLRC